MITVSNPDRPNFFASVNIGSFEILEPSKTHFQNFMATFQETAKKKVPDQLLICEIN